MKSLLFLIIWTLLFERTRGESCKFASPCSCSTSDFVIDLLPLMKKQKGSPLIDKSQKNTVYYMNPCGHPLKVQQCQGLGNTAAGCQFQANTAYGIAKTTGYTAEGDPKKGTVHFSYSFTDAQHTRSAVLTVNCGDTDLDFQFVNESPKLTYNFLLKTRFACQKRASSGISVGSVLLILFFVTVIIYIILGILFLKFVRKAEGLEVIPQYEFWKDLPFLIKEYPIVKPFFFDKPLFLGTRRVTATVIG